ncbi:hypothetical protein UlMin_031982 [Ulmus minor]
MGGKIGYAALKLDMSKAYDKVEWDFLRGMMVKLGFSLQWVELLLRCITTGDPLSLYLFVICAHGLSEMLTNFEQMKFYKGVSLASTCPSISHLFFADNSMLFCRAWPSECFQLRQCLLNYAKASGQSINFDKSTLYFSPNTGDQNMEEICSMFEISQVEGHDMYLGLPTFSMRNKIIQFGYI